MNRLALFAAGFAAAVAITALNYIFDADLRAVQRGELTLVCTIKDGERAIDPARVTGFIDDTWIFDNGYAKNCKVIKGRSVGDARP